MTDGIQQVCVLSHQEKKFKSRKAGRMLSAVNLPLLAEPGMAGNFQPQEQTEDLACWLQGMQAEMNLG